MGKKRNMLGWNYVVAAYITFYGVEEIVDGNLRLNKRDESIMVNGQLLKSTSKEFQLLLYLLQNKNRILTKEELFHQIWGNGSDSEMQTFTVHIKRLRNKIEEDPEHPKRILTVWGKGYRMELEKKRKMFLLSLTHDIKTPLSVIKLNAQVLQNITENALKYGDGDAIELVGEKWESAFSFKVTNTGCNLDEREVVHIFDSFFRGTNVEGKEGSGLGLFICRKLVGMMEGEIYAQIVEWNGKKALKVTVILPYS